ncbi:hypothetical protein MSG28_003649, partial [Choristoneura fumiferana]
MSDLLMSRLERRKMKKEALEKQKMKRDKKQKVVNAEEEDEASGDDDDVNFEAEGDSEEERAHSDDEDINNEEKSGSEIEEQNNDSDKEVEEQMEFDEETDDEKDFSEEVSDEDGDKSSDKFIPHQENDDEEGDERIVKEDVPELRAIAFVADPRGPDIQGNVTFTQTHDGKVRVEGTILGLNHGQYGFHVHEKGDITGGCLSTGSHFNPEHKQHGHPNDEDRHVGDLGNVEFDETRIGRIDFVDNLISLVGPHSILGRGLVLHERADDFGRSDHPDSRKTGNAGGRVACGVIGI